MTTISRPAALVKQGSLKLYTTSLRVADLLIPGFYRIDKLDPDDQTTGYQRLLNTTRAKKLAEYLVTGHEEKDAFLPTSIFLATSRALTFDASSNTLHIEIGKDGPFNVVDGQHRIAGLVEATKEAPELKDFEVPANIAVELSDVAQMCHFLIVNTTQRSVDKAVEQQIVARLTEMVQYEDVPSLPKWIQRQVQKGEDERALAIARYLNSEKDSPWLGKIEMANQEDGLDATTVAQKSFVTSLKKNVLVPSNPISTMELDDQKKVLKNYWRSVASLLHEPGEQRSTVVFKTGGLEVFHIASGTVLTHAATKGDYRVDTITALLKKGLDGLSTEFVGAASHEWWLRGEGASQLNQAGMRKLAHAISSAINQKTAGGKIVA